MPVSLETIQWIKIIAVCILSFGPSLLLYHHDFVYDDGVAIVKNPDVTNTNQSIINNVQSILMHDFWGQNLTDERSHKSFRPMVTLMFHLEFRYFDQTNLPVHMKRVNLLLHIAICCVIYDFLRRVFKDIDHSIVSIATLLFAAHPIHTEVICSVVGRADLMCSFFFLTTFSHFMDVVEGHEKNGKVNWLSHIILFDAALMCILCKEVGIMVLPFCAVYDILTNITLPRVRRRDVSRRFEFLRKSCQTVIIRCVYLALMTVGLMLIRGYFAQYKLPKFSPQENPIAAHPSLFTRLLSSCYIHALNMWLLICPDWLCCDWSNGSLKLIEMWTDHRIPFAILFYILIIYAFIIGPRHVRIAIAFLVVPFIPSSNLVTVGFVLADRVLYIPSIGYCLLIAFGTQAILPLSPKIIRCVIVLLLLLFMMRSNERSIDWQNNLQLFKSAVRVCPNNAKIYYNLGQISAAKGNQNKSLEYNLIANELQPNTISTLINLGNAYRHLGHTQNAIEFHKRVTNLEPKHPLGWMNLGISYVKNGSFTEALHAYLKADELKPNNEKITFNLGNLYLRMGDRMMAEKMYRKSVQIDPRSQRAHINLIVYLSEHGTQDELMAAIDSANLTLSDNLPVLSTIANALTRINFDFERVERLYHHILKLDPRNFLAHVQLSIQYQKRDQPKKAIKHYKKARNLNPTFQIKDEKFIKFMEKWEAAFATSQEQKKTT